PGDVRVTLTAHRPPRSEGVFAKRALCVEERRLAERLPETTPYIALLRSRGRGHNRDIRIRCLRGRDGRVRIRDADSRVWRRGQFGDGCCSAASGGGTVTWPTGSLSSSASRRARVRDQYFGASSRYRLRGQYGRTRMMSVKYASTSSLCRTQEAMREKMFAAALAWSCEPKKSHALRPTAMGERRARSARLLSMRRRPSSR